MKSHRPSVQVILRVAPAPRLPKVRPHHATEPMHPGVAAERLLHLGWAALFHLERLNRISFARFSRLSHRITHWCSLRSSSSSVVSVIWLLRFSSLALSTSLSSSASSYMTVVVPAAVESDEPPPPVRPSQTWWCRSRHRRLIKKSSRIIPFFGKPTKSISPTSWLTTSRISLSLSSLLVLRLLPKGPALSSTAVLISLWTATGRFLPLGAN